MELILWSDRFSVNNEIIDSQHRKLINLINELHSAVTAPKGREISQVILDEFAVYLKIHFYTEEMIMKKAAFPGYSQHKEEHSKLTIQFSDFQEKLKTEDLPLTLDALYFLKDWIINHIEIMDRGYIDKI